jgi:2',3'-cyclic-nucleotide 2'-phosphodiesterase (5'-nucleotidase family)
MSAIALRQYQGAMTRRSLPGIALSLVAAGPIADLEVVSHGSTRSRLASDDADLVILYAGEQEGRLGPCGCSELPLGGIDRAAGYASAVKAQGRPTILVNPGTFLTSTLGDDGATLRPDSVVADRAMVDLLAGWDALNVSFRDLPYLAEHGFPATAVSANLHATEGEGPLPVVVLQRDGLRVAVTGVTSWGTARIQPARFTWGDPVASLTAALSDVDADVVVVLSYGVPAKALAVPGVDAIVEASEYRQLDPPLLAGDAVFVRSWTAGERMGELRLQLEGGVVTEAHERVVALDRRVRADAEVAREERDRQEEIDAVQVELFGGE